MIRKTMTENGAVEGIEAADPRITAFKGIPFAAPPVGENRWRAPKPCPKWEGTRRAYRFAPISVQDTPGVGTDIYCREWHVDPDIAMDEDCLYLNVWTGAKSIEDKQPVLVWFFGGALQWGYPAEMEFDGERIARRGVVVVTVNYRLNVFGFLAHPQLTAEQPDEPTNFGNLDQQAGLKWVIRNIRAFGGDPENITIAGQSAGGGSVLTQMTCPANFGLFQKAIVESAMIHSPYDVFSIVKPRSLKEAEELGVKFFEYIGVNSLEEARKLDAFHLLKLYSKFAGGIPLMLTSMDGKFCVGHPLELIMQNKYARVPLMSGNTIDEFPNAITANSDEEFIKKAKEHFGDRAEEFLKFEEAWKKEGNQYAKVSGLECTIKSLFRHIQEDEKAPNTYYYRFGTEIPGWDNPGNFHSVDLWFFFETLAKCWRPFKGRDYDLARQMCNYWCNFIKNGDPNGKDNDGTDLPYWGPYTNNKPCGMFFSTEGAVSEEKEATEFEKFIMDTITEDLLK